MKTPSPELLKAPSLEDLSTAELVDMLGPIEEELTRVSARIVPLEKKAKAIESVLKKRVPEPDAKTLDGGQFFALVGEKNLATTWRIDALFKRLKRDVFMTICSVGSEKVKAVVPEWEKYCTQERTGARTVATHRYPQTEVKVA